MELKECFTEITKFDPYNFQMASMELLSQGNSLILMAPTGSGKSEVAMVPFILNKNEKLPSQMIYSLPTRTLIDNLSQRAEKYAQKFSLKTAFHHGKRIESELFNEDMILTTIDQTVGAYVCTPLTAPIKRGNILAGAVSSSFLVFDEIHTFDPNRGLQTAMTLIEHSSKLGLPFAVMSATLPDVLISKIKKIAGECAKSISVEDENEIKSRKDRKVILHTKPLKQDKKLSAEDILELFASSAGKLVIVCNTVDKAQQVYVDLKKSNKIDEQIILLHSRFLDDDRSEKEKKIIEIFGKDSKSKDAAILIGTQIIEAGIDISSNMMISELAPIDSLIQRAGRCARWGGNGAFYVFDIEDYGPYREKAYQQIVDNTRDELKKLDNELFSWNLERKLVNSILSEYYSKILEDSKRAEIIGTLARAVFEGNRSKAEETVRDAYTCTVSIHDNPQILCNANNDVFRLQKVNMNVWVFRSKIKKLLETGGKIWSIEESNILDDYTFALAPVLVSDPDKQILPFKHYIVSSEGAYYDNGIGLLFGRAGKDSFGLSHEKTIEDKEREFDRKYESWIEHSNKTLEVLNANFIPRYSFAISKFANAFNVDRKELIEKIRIAVALHDIGKLNRYWQDKLKWDGKIPLAHTNREDIGKIGIPHATVSASALNFLYNDWNALGYPLLLAIAHHHSPRSQEYKPYDFVDIWESVIEELQVSIDIKRITSKKKISDRFEFSMPYLGDESNVIAYRFYSFASKMLRLSDWIATAGESNGILHS